jgi:hypothetical protein
MGLQKGNKNCSMNFICTGEVNVKVLPKETVKNFTWNGNQKEKFQERK